MKISFLILKQIAELLIMMLVGFTLVRIKLLKPSDNKALSIVSIYLVCPAMIILAFQTPPTRDKVEGLLFALLTALVVHAVSIFVTGVFKKLFRLSDMEIMSVIYTNAGNLVLPNVLATLGEEYVALTSGYMVV